MVFFSISSQAIASDAHLTLDLVIASGNDADSPSAIPIWVWCVSSLTLFYHFSLALMSLCVGSLLVCVP